ncbi:MAG: AI-2E family transporter [Rubrobacter sp.]|nr:AI-2E family transporter [Rubrobacter sp.]
MGLAVYFALQQIESNLLEPLVMEKAASIHPSAVILAVTTLGSAFRVFRWHPGRPGGCSRDDIH